MQNEYNIKDNVWLDEDNLRTYDNIPCTSDARISQLHYFGHMRQNVIKQLEKAQYAWLYKRKSISHYFIVLTKKELL